VLATPTYDRRAAVSAHCGAGAIPALALALLAFFGLLRDAKAEDVISDFAAEFYSYLPAAPDIKAPDLDFVPFWTDELKKAKKAYKNGNYDKALKFFLIASDQGNIVADWYLGHMYRLGRGVERSDAKALSYYGRVADAFNADETDQNRLRIMVDSLVRVADAYRTGSKNSGVEQDYDRALRLYRLASTFGHPAAQYGLGVMTLQGLGIKAKPDQGLKWLVASARKRYAPAEAMLGEIYWKGEYVERDSTRALMWYLLAQDTARPEENPEIIDRLDVLLSQASEEERLEAEARATVWADQYPLDAPVVTPTGENSTEP
jgi:TPR repeat protein